MLKQIFIKTALFCSVIINCNFLYASPVKITGTILNAPDKKVELHFVRTGLIGYSKDTFYRCEIDKQGKFKIYFSIQGIEEMYLQCADNFFSFIVTEGDSLSINIGFVSKKPQLKIYGTHANENIFFQKLNDYKNSARSRILVKQNDKFQNVLASVLAFNDSIMDFINTNGKAIDNDFIKYMLIENEYHNYHSVYNLALSKHENICDKKYASFWSRVNDSNAWAAANCPHYLYFISNCYVLYKLLEPDGASMYDEQDYGMNKLFNKAKDLSPEIKEYLLAQYVAWAISALDDDLINVFYSYFLLHVKNDNLAEPLAIQFKNYQKMHLNNFPTGAKFIKESYSDLNDLIKLYKGKVVYVDFWASWCVPCKNEMPYSQKLKKDFANQGIEFLYIAINDKTENWQNAIKKYTINGNHVKLTDEQSKSIGSIYKIDGIPRYMIFSSDGSLINSDASVPSDSLIYEQLSDALNVNYFSPQQYYKVDTNKISVPQCEYAITIYDSIYGPTKIKAKPKSKDFSFSSQDGDYTKYLKIAPTGWYTFTIEKDCYLTLDIIPEYNRDDYDFFLFKNLSDTFCDAIHNNRIEQDRHCLSQYFYNSSKTGLNKESKQFFSPPGNNPPYVSGIDAKAGDIFYLMVTFAMGQQMPFKIIVCIQTNLYFLA